MIGSSIGSSAPPPPLQLLILLNFGPRGKRLLHYNLVADKRM